MKQQKKPIQAKVHKKITLFNKVNVIGYNEINIYIVLCRHSYFYTFNNKDSLKWLPTKKDLI